MKLAMREHSVTGERTLCLRDTQGLLVPLVEREEVLNFGGTLAYKCKFAAKFADFGDGKKEIVCKITDKEMKNAPVVKVGDHIVPKYF